MDDIDALLAARANVPTPKPYAYSEGPDPRTSDPNVLRIETAGASTPSASAAPSNDPLSDLLSARAAGQEIATPTAEVQKAPKPELKMGSLGDLAYGGAKGAADLVQAPAQLLINGYSKLYHGLPGVGDWFGKQANDINDYLKNQETAYQADTPGSVAAGVGRVSSGILPFLLSGGSSAAPQVAGALPKIAQALKMAGQGAAITGATQPIIDVNQDKDGGNDFFERKGMQAAIGAGSSVAGAALGKVAARLIRPETSKDVQVLLDAGVTPTTGQILGGGFKRAEDALTSVPIIGDFVRNAQRRTLADLNTAAVNRSLEPIGDKLSKGAVGRDAIEEAGKKLGNAYDTVLNRIGATVPDAQFHADITNLSHLTQNLPQASADQFQRIIKNEILDRIKNSAITSDGLKAAESNLGQLARGYGRDPNYDTRQMGLAIQEAQNAIRTMVQRTNPTEAANLQKVNAGYANFLRTQRAASSVGAENGAFTAAQLQNAVKALDSSKNKGAFARGDALMQDLSEAAKNVLPSKVPDSGTPYRHAIQGLVAGAAGHSMLPEAAAGMVVPGAIGVALGSAPYSSIGQKVAAALLAKRPAAAAPIANAVRSGAPFIGPAVSPLLLQMLKEQSN